MRYGAIHLVLWLIGIIYWVVKAPGNKKTVRRVPAGPRLVALSIIALSWYLLLTPREGWTAEVLLPQNSMVQLAGVLICAAGITIAIWARHTLGRNWSGVPTVKESHELITSGPYHFVRHPIYTGLLLAIFGTAFVAHGRLGGLLFFLILATMLHIKSRVEERFMLETFPQAYPEYRRRTKAIIPFVL